MNYVLLPVPAEVLDELELDEYSTVQYSVSKGRLIIEPIDVQKVVVTASAGSLLQSLSKLIEGKYQEQEKKLRQTIDRKQRREIQEKKQAMGLRE